MSARFSSNQRNRGGHRPPLQRVQLYRLLLAIVLTATVAVGETPPKEWVDPATGHRVVRLSDESGTASLYFHQNPYTASGDKMVVTTREGLATIELRTRKIEPLVVGPVSQVVVGKKTRQVFYMKDGTVYATHLDTHTTRAQTPKGKEFWLAGVVLA